MHIRRMVKSPWHGGPGGSRCELKILDDDGNELPAGEVGMVYISAPHMGLHSILRTKKRARKPSRGTTIPWVIWVISTKINGSFLADRRSRPDYFRGVNIYPAEIEQVLQAHSDVYDAAVFGLPNDEWGQEVKAVVQLVDQTKHLMKWLEQLLEYCSAKLAKYKLPRSIDFARGSPIQIAKAL